MSTPVCTTPMLTPPCGPAVLRPSRSHSSQVRPTRTTACESSCAPSCLRPFFNVQCLTQPPRASAPIPGQHRWCTGRPEQGAPRTSGGRIVKDSRKERERLQQGDLCRDGAPVLFVVISQGIAVFAFKSFFFSELKKKKDFRANTDQTQGHQYRTHVR